MVAFLSSRSISARLLLALANWMQLMICFPAQTGPVTAASEYSTTLPKVDDWKLKLNRYRITKNSSFAKQNANKTF